jgi:uncharacterized protein
MPTVDLRPRSHRHDNGQTPAPAIDDSPWAEQVEASPQYLLQFRTRGRGPNHSLVPLNQIMDERYSVYLRNTTTSS